MAQVLLKVNGTTRRTDTRDNDLLADVLYRNFGMPLHRSCEGRCAACVVHVNGSATRSCATRVSDVIGSDIVTIDGLSRSEGLSETELHAVERAWREEGVPVCSCRAGLIMAVAALLMVNPSPTQAEVDAAIPMPCGCGVKPRVYRVIRSLAEGMARW